MRGTLAALPNGRHFGPLGRLEIPGSTTQRDSGSQPHRSPPRVLTKS
jgi:hypothetical protein